MSRRKIDDDLNESNESSLNSPEDVKELSQADLDYMLLESYLTKGEEGIEKAIDALTQGANLNARIGLTGPNLLYLAASNNNRYMFDWLLDVTQKGKRIEVDYMLNDDVHYLTGLLKENIDPDMLKEIVSSFDMNVDILDKQGNTPLIRAMFSNNYSLVKVLLDAGANPSQKLKRSNVTPLLFAASECFDDIVKPLLDAGADVKAVDMDGHNSLMASLLREPMTLPKSKRSGLLKAINMLLDHPDIEVNLKTSSGIQPLFMSMHREEYMGVFLKLLEKGADVNAKYEDGYYSRGLETPLHYAARLGKMEYVSALVDAGAEMSVEDKFGNSPESYLLLNPEVRGQFLHKFITEGRSFSANAVWGDIDHENQFDAKAIKKSTVFKLLLLDIKFSEVEDEEDMQNKMTALAAVNYFFDNGIKITLKDTPDLHESEPLFAAMVIGDKGVVNKILDMNKSKNEIDFNFVFNIGDKYVKNEQTYISYLMNEADILSGKKLQNDFKKELNDARKNVMKKGRTGTESAEEAEKRKEELNKEKESLKTKFDLEKEEVKKDKLEIFDILIKAGANPDQVLSSDGKTALFNLKEAYWIKEFHERGLNILPKDENGYTPLDYAILKNNKEIVNAYKEIMPIPDNTLYKLAFFDYSNFNQKKEITAQLGIVSSFYPENEYVAFNKNHNQHIFGTKIKQVSYVDDDGNTPLLAAVANGSSFLSNLLIQMGADVNAKNQNNETALQYSCSNGLDTVAVKLLEFGADASVVNEQGFSAYDFAKSEKMSNVVKLMEEKLKPKGLKI